MTTVALTNEQYQMIINTLYRGVRVTPEGPAFGCPCRTIGESGIEPNIPVATALQIEANTGIRIGDVLSLKRGDIIKDGDKYRFDIREQKTKKKRTYVVPVPVWRLIDDYCTRCSIPKGGRLFPFGVRNVQKLLGKITTLYNYDKISTHSFRKYFGKKAYIASNFDPALVCRLFQHSSPAVTMTYLGLTDRQAESVLTNSVGIVSQETTEPKDQEKPKEGDNDE